MASGTESTIQEVVGIFLRGMGIQPKVHFTGQVKTGDPLHWKADISKLSALGFSPKVSIQDGIKRYTQWLQEERLP